MPFIPHTEDDVQSMLKTIGVDTMNALFDEIPAELQQFNLDQLPSGLSELALNRLAKHYASQDGQLTCYIGAGAYEHHIPAAVWEVATRGEFMTAYTPYQAEASQGSLQLLYEYQTMMASLMGLDVSNASLYDGASALAEAILMAVRIKNKKGEANILVPRSLHPAYRQTVQTIVSQQNISLIDVPFDITTGQVDQPALAALVTTETAALVIAQPNFFGVLEDVDALTNVAKTHQLLSIAVVNPMAMALLKPPGQWGTSGVDIACGEGQPLGLPLASGGPYYGFLCSQQSHVRQMPGRIVGRTVDLEGKEGFVLTLQAREQHIRRAKATSNICTNQGLMVTASTIYMSLMGPLGLRAVALQCHERTRELKTKLLALKGVSTVFNSPYFHEIVIRVSGSAEKIITNFAKQRIQAGFSLTPIFPELGECLLLCATETKTQEDITTFVTQFAEALDGRAVPCHL